MDTQPVRVLLVDDDEEDYIVTRDLLSEVETGRYELEWVSTYEAGLEEVELGRHDVYLIDYHLGPRNGLELLRQSLQIGCQAPMILLTGRGDQEVDLEAMRAGAADYMVKGQIDAAQLERSIRYAVERRRAIEENAALERQLHEAQKMEAVGQLAGGIAHDFSNLLTAIMGYTQLGATMATPASPLRTHFQEIRKAAQRASDLTRQLLAFSRQQIIEQTVVSLNELVLNTHRMLRRLIGEDIEIVTIAAPDLGLVKVNPGQIEQVLINLAINARDAMPDGGKLTIETADATPELEYALRRPDLALEEYVSLAVTDSGTGMTEAVQARIFEPFITTKEPGKGTGLGLSTCYGIVKQNGGHISVFSEPGMGTTFGILLPRVDGSETVQVGGESYGRSLEGREMLLVVDDEEAVRDMVGQVLRQQGYTVLEAENGGEALKVVEEFAENEIGLDLLLTDIVMPIMGGRELAYRLRAKQSVARVLYTSGYADAAVIHHGPLQPDADFIPKPFTPDALTSKIREMLDR